MRRVDGEAEESHQGGRRDREISHPRGGLPKLIIPHFLVMCCSIFTNFLFFNQYHYFAFLPSFFLLTLVIPISACGTNFRKKHAHYFVKSQN